MGMMRPVAGGAPLPAVATAKRIVAPSLLPIQFAWVFFVDCDQSIQDRLDSSRSTYRATRKNHSDSKRCGTGVLHRSHAPAITCWLARTVWRQGHQLNGAISFSASHAQYSSRKSHCVHR